MSNTLPLHVARSWKAAKFTRAFQQSDAANAAQSERMSPEEYDLPRQVTCCH
jgi:hypothetical protein